jgi:hypothetical protein
MHCSKIEKYEKMLYKYAQNYAIGLKDPKYINL